MFRTRMYCTALFPHSEGAGPYGLREHLIFSEVFHPLSLGKNSVSIARVHLLEFEGNSIVTVDR